MRRDTLKAGHRVLTAGAVAMALALFLSPLVAAKEKDKGKDAKKTSKVIATINGEPVTKDDYDTTINGNRRFFDLSVDSIRRRLGGKPWTEYVFNEEIVKVRAFAQRRAAELPAMKAKIEEAQKKIAGGEDFAAVAREMSEDKSTAPNGGSLGAPKTFFDLVQPFNRVAFSMRKEGEVSDPVLTIFGYHLIRVDHIFPPMEGKPKRVEVSHILINFSGNPRQEAEEALAQAKVEILVKVPYCKYLPDYCEGKK
ncbi:MAG TPA: peptidylprolyl isomerase [Candidatus Saccharimonadales bacterium]|nr:peptidylprolyl isomerase [Candidatus Saccharimonadales bacterium]